MKYLRSPSRLQFGSRNVHGAIFSVDRAVPDTAAKRSDVNCLRIRWIGDNAMAPFEIKTGDSRPMFTTIRRDPRRRFKSSGIQNLCVPRINRYVVDVTIAIQYLSPS